MYLLSHVYLYRRLSRSRRILRSPSCLLALSIFYLWCVLCDYLSLFLWVFFFLSVAMVLLSPFVFVTPVAVSHSCAPALKAVILSPSLTARLMFGPPASAAFCFARDATAHCFPCYLGILHAILASRPRRARGGGRGGYLAAISGFIFLRYLPGLSSCCRPGVIARRNQGGDLSPWQPLKTLPGMSWWLLLSFFFFFCSDCHG